MDKIIDKKYQKLFRVTCPKAYGHKVQCKEPEFGRRCFYCNIAKLLYGDQDIHGEPSEAPITTKCLSLYIEEVKDKGGIAG